MHYPKLGHIGFKLLCATLGYFSLQHMQLAAEQRQEMARIGSLKDPTEVIRTQYDQSTMWI